MGVRARMQPAPAVGVGQAGAAPRCLRPCRAARLPWAGGPLQAAAQRLQALSQQRCRAHLRARSVA